MQKNDGKKVGNRKRCVSPFICRLHKFNHTSILYKKSNRTAVATGGNELSGSSRVRICIFCTVGIMIRCALLALIIATLVGPGSSFLQCRHGEVRLQHSSSALSCAADNVAVKVIVSGKNIQGPWYRGTVKQELVFNRKCRGMLTEMPNDRTEILVEGSKKRVDGELNIFRILVWASRLGC
jgi:hypothetical protein